MTTTLSGEHVLVTGSAKTEEELKNKKIKEQAIWPKNHFKHHHLFYSVWGKHLDVAAIFLKNLLLEISERKA